MNLNNSERFNFEVMYNALPSRFVKVSLTVAEFLNILRTGLHYNDAVDKIAVTDIVFAHETDEDGSIVYDIVAAKSGGEIWSVR